MNPKDKKQKMLVFPFLHFPSVEQIKKKKKKNQIDRRRKGEKVGVALRSSC